MLSYILHKRSESRRIDKVCNGSAFSYFRPPPQIAIGFLKYQNKNRQIFKGFADDLLTVY